MVSDDQPGLRTRQNAVNPASHYRADIITGHDVKEDDISLRRHPGRGSRDFGPGLHQRFQLLFKRLGAAGIECQRITGCLEPERNRPPHCTQPDHANYGEFHHHPA